MKKLLAMALALCMLLSLVPAASAAGNGMTQAEAEAAIASLNAGSDFYYELVDKYDDSEIKYRTEVRWWMAEGAHTDETLEEEVQAMFDAGFRGVELCQLAVSGLDETVWGLGTEQWNHDFHVVVNKALDLGMSVGITSGTNWNTTNVPGLNPDGQEAMQCVLDATETVPAGQTRTGSIPKASNLRAVNSFIGAYAYRIVPGTSKPIQIDETSVLDLTDKIVDNEGVLSLEWTAPEDGDYYIFYLWSQGTAQESNPSVDPAYCVNYFDVRGFEAWTEFFSKTVLNDPALNEKIMAGDVQLFMDSLEFNWGRGFTFWAEDFAEEFEARKGYDIRPYLILAKGLASASNNFDVNADFVSGTYELTNGILGQQIRNDLHDVQTELYMERLMVPMEAWLNQYNIALRAQISYGRTPEISEPSMTVDFPEAENLNQRNQVDTYRLWTGAAKLENKILSSETGATFGMSYAYDHQRHLQEAYSLYASGFSRIGWHIWTSSWSPVTTRQSWPGFQNLSLCNVVGLREPGYAEYYELNQHLGRVQKLMREGKARADVGMVYLKYNQEIPFTISHPEEDMWMQRHDYMMFPSTELQENGYTYDYFSHEFLNSDKVYFDAENGTLELAGYKALVLWQTWLALEGAEDILDLAKQGMKVVVVDGAAEIAPYNEDEAALAAAMAELKALDNVKTAATADDVMEALQELGVEPYAAFESNQLLTQVRQDGDNLYLYVYNYCDGTLHDDDADHGLNCTTEVAMDGTFIPYFIDAWTGEVSQVANYRWEDGKTVITVDVNYGDVALYAFEAVETEPEHVLVSDADTYITENGIVLRATESGTYETQLAYGRTVKTDVQVPAAYEITDWDLTVEAWTKGEEIFREDTQFELLNREHTYATTKTNIEGIELDTLTTWENIPEVGKGVSGKGYYSATFHWAGEADGAYLDFGSILNSMKVYINGKQTDDVNMNIPVVDISDLLVEGENTIELVYSSTLTNELLETGAIRVGGGSFFGPLWGGYTVDYRSYGPAQAIIVPYVEENITILESNDVTVNLTGEAEVTVDVTEVAYDVTVSGAEGLATATLSFSAENLSDVTVTPAEGWMAYAVTEEDGIVEIVMGSLEGVNGEATIATVTGATNGKVGTASLTLVEAVLSAYVGDSETFVNVLYGETTVETTIDYSTFDVNQDGTVNQLDITRAQRYFGTTDEICNVDGEGDVGIADLVLILNNYSK